MASMPQAGPPPRCRRIGARPRRHRAAVRPVGAATRAKPRFAHPKGVAPRSHRTPFGVLPYREAIRAEGRNAEGHFEGGASLLRGCALRDGSPRDGRGSAGPTREALEGALRPAAIRCRTRRPAAGRDAAGPVAGSRGRSEGGRGGRVEHARRSRGSTAASRVRATGRGRPGGPTRAVRVRVGVSPRGGTGRGGRKPGLAAAVLVGSSETRARCRVRSGRRPPRRTGPTAPGRPGPDGRRYPR